MADTPDYRDELIATQRKLIELQTATLATLRAYLQAAHDTAEKHERTIAAMRDQAAPKDMQA